EYFSKFDKQLYLESGIANLGKENTGFANSGDRNSGDRNSGNSNSGYRNSGAFCTDNNPILYLFNKPTDIRIKDWENHKAVQIMHSIDTTIWVSANLMSEEEKLNNEGWEA